MSIPNSRGHGFSFSAQNRPQMIEKLKMEIQDVAVIGGGINGAICSAALSSAGFKTALIEKNDFASLTSQSSSNLIWGGIKYLENYEFSLVNDLCKSRNRLMKIFPETVKEIRFYSTHEKGFRFPLWFLYAGTWFYSLVGHFFTKNPRLLSLQTIQQEEPIINTDLFDGGFEYSDAYLPETDTRFVFHFIKKSFRQGALPVNYLEVFHAEFDGEFWNLSVRNDGQEEFKIRSRYLINAAGPYTDSFNSVAKTETTHCHLFSKGIHLIFPQLTKTKKILTFFANDGRLFFIVPMGNRSCVGTTDTRTDRPESFVSADDRKFILENVNRLLNLKTPLTKADIIAERCGVRPLVAVAGEQKVDGDWFNLSREHKIDLDAKKKIASIFGGKLTDCLNIGEEILSMMKKDFGEKFSMPDLNNLGGKSLKEKQAFFDETKKLNLDSQTPDFAEEPISERLWRRYGDESVRIIELLKENFELSEPIQPNAEVYQVEAIISAESEMVQKIEDFLRRRTLLSLTVPKESLNSDVFEPYFDVGKY